MTPSCFLAADLSEVFVSHEKPASVVEEVTKAVLKETQNNEPPEAAAGINIPVFV